jgi:predicted nucleotidyltransferase
MDSVETKLADLLRRLQQAFGSQLVSAILYGSAAAGDYHEGASDLNVLCVLRQITPRELLQSEPVLRWWREGGNPPPLLLSEEEVRTSSDCFPLEFHDLQEQRRVLFGPDVLAEVAIDRSFYRAQVEHELRAKQIRLRQKAAEVLSNSDRLIRLMVDSVSTFCVLGRHALILSGGHPRWKKQEVVNALGDLLVLQMDGFNAVLSLRADPKQKPKPDGAALFSQYLKEVDTLVRFVDRLDPLSVKA